MLPKIENSRTSKVGLLPICYRWITITVFKKPVSQQLGPEVKSRAAKLEMTLKQLNAIQCKLDKIDVGDIANSHYHEKHHQKQSNV